MIKKYFSVAAFILAISISFTAYSQDNEFSPKIALIDLKKVETESIAWKSLSKQINARRTKVKNQIQEIQSKLEKKSKNLESQRAILSADAFAVEVSEFKKERAKLDQTARIQKQNLDKAFLDARGQIRKAVNISILEFIKKNKITLLLKAGDTESTVYFATTNMFINDQVLALLNQKIKTVTLLRENSE